VNQHVAIIRPDSDKLDPRFLRYFLVSPAMQARLLSWAGAGGTRNALTKGMIESFEVPAPEDIEEQRAIAHILGTLDDKIELNRRMSETLEEMALALFKSWFVDFDPVRAKAEGRDPGLPKPLADLFPDRLVDSGPGEIPDGWEMGTLADLVELVRDQVQPLDSPGMVFRHHSIPAFDEGQWPHEERGQTIRSHKFRVPPGVVLLSKLNPEIERVWLVDVAQSEHAVCSTEFLVLRPLPPAGRAFIYSFARSSVFRREIEALVTGTSKSHQRAQAASVLAMSVTRPTAPLAEAFERQAGPLLERVLDCRRESRALAVLRDALLPKLVSGELRVTDAERFLGNAV
jgi:type I restriction enzyme S subunit